MDPCPLAAREGPYLLTCCLPAGHDGDCWCTLYYQIGLALASESGAATKLDYYENDAL